MKNMNTFVYRALIPAAGAPILIFLYGLLRLLDMMDGNHSPHGIAWNLGHVLFFIAFVLFGVLAIELRRLVPARSVLAKLVAYMAMAAGLFGAACFLWGILGDLFVRLQNTAPVPGPLRIAGPLLFQVGMLWLLVMLSAMPPRKLPAWSPILVLVGFVLFAVNLNLIPISALILMAGLLPLFRGVPLTSGRSQVPR